jgi:hypothetical protein
MLKHFVGLCIWSWCCALTVTAQQPPAPEAITFQPDQSVYVVAVDFRPGSGSVRWMPTTWREPILDCARMARVDLSKANPLGLRFPSPGHRPDHRPGHRPDHRQDDRPMLDRPLPERPTLDRDPPDRPADQLSKSSLLAKRAVEQVFQKQKKFRIADSAEGADFVFWVEVRYVPPRTPGGVFMGRGDGTSYDVRNDRIVENTHLMGAFALVVSPQLYRQKGNQHQALLDGSIWRGITVGVGQEEASLLELVKCFHEEALKK